MLPGLYEMYILAEFVNMNCEWPKPDDGTGVCIFCGKPRKRPIPGLLRNCAVRLAGVPPITQRVQNFGKALTRHVRAGMPRASQETIDARFAICQQCPLLVDGVCSHMDCGCPITRESKFKSKLAWADQGCPVGKWGPVADGH